MNQQPGMSLVVRTVARWVKPFILLFGIYIVIYGHLTPGGGFSGGVIIACALVLLTLALGQKAALAAVSRRQASTLDSLGALLFLGIAVSGTCVGGFFFWNFIATPAQAHFRLLSGGTIPLSNIAVGLKVSMSLFLAFTVLSALHVHHVQNGERRIGRRGDKP
jgi:multicomponent Na+:H+ antiporter subunit B